MNDNRNDDRQHVPMSSTIEKLLKEIEHDAEALRLKMENVHNLQHGQARDQGLHLALGLRQYEVTRFDATRAGRSLSHRMTAD